MQILILGAIYDSQAVGLFVIIADNARMDKSFIKKIGRNIKKLRKEQGLSQDDLACDANVSRSTISMFETAQNDMTLTKIKSIAIALGVEPYELLKFN